MIQLEKLKQPEIYQYVKICNNKDKGELVVLKAVSILELLKVNLLKK